MSQVDILLFQIPDVRLPMLVIPDLADNHGVGPELSRHHALIGALAPEPHEEVRPEDCLSGFWELGADSDQVTEDGGHEDYSVVLGTHFDVVKYENVTDRYTLNNLITL